jgi:uncharacterized membrane protein
MTSRYFSGDPRDFCPDGEFYENQTRKYVQHFMPFISHVLFGLTTMVLGPFLINQRFRERHLQLHRQLGKVYVTAALAGASCGFYFTFHVYGGLSPMIAGWLKSSYWFIATALAYTSVRRRKLKQHRIWMVRSYALAFEPIAFKLWTLAGLGFGMSVASVMQILSWLSAVSTIAAVEIYLRRSAPRARRSMAAPALA